MNCLHSRGTLLLHCKHRMLEKYELALISMFDVHLAPESSFIIKIEIAAGSKLGVLAVDQILMCMRTSHVHRYSTWRTRGYATLPRPGTRTLSSSDASPAMSPLVQHSHGVPACRRRVDRCGRQARRFVIQPPRVIRGRLHSGCHRCSRSRYVDRDQGAGLDHCSCA